MTKKKHQSHLKLRKKYIWFLSGAVLIIIMFWIWYAHRYTMDTVIPFETGDKYAKNKVLIASQGSAFKDSLVTGIIKSYKNKPVFFKVIDAYTLFTVKIAKWDAIVIINSWEYGSPPKNVRQFIENHPDQHHKLILLSTVGSYRLDLSEIDAITGESILEKVPDYTNIINKKLNRIIDLE